MRDVEDEFRAGFTHRADADTDTTGRQLQVPSAAQRRTRIVAGVAAAACVLAIVATVFTARALSSYILRLHRTGSATDPGEAPKTDAGPANGSEQSDDPNAGTSPAASMTGSETPAPPSESFRSAVPTSVSAAPRPRLVSSATR